MRPNLSDEPLTAELLVEALRRTGSARLAINGNSMHPTLQMGWWVHVEPARGEELKAGSIAVFRSEHYLTVHRLAFIERGSGATTLVFRGDYNRQRERVPASAVLGRVVAVEIPGPQRGMERVVTLEADVLTLFYRAAQGVHGLGGPALPGTVGRFMRRGLAGVERALSLFLPQRR